MEKGTVIGIGGVFFKAEDPEGLCKWYETCLGMKVASDFTGGTFPISQMPEKGYSIWSAFPSNTKYLDGSTKGFMMNLVVDDVAAVLERVKKNGGNVAGGPEETEYGDFGWVIDPEGNKVELWKPK